MTTTNAESIVKAIGAGSIGFGVLATLSPRTLRRSYGDRASSGGSLDYFGRTWGTRTAVLGVLSMTASSDDERKRLAGITAAMNAVDALAALRADGMPRSTRMMAALTSGAFSAAGAYVAING